MISVLRLGHRPARDVRTTTHVCLVARAFGADEVLIPSKDRRIEESISNVVRKFGGSFRVKSGVNWRRLLKSWEGKIVHLTMYGEPLEEALRKIPDEDLLIVVGSEKVPREVFELAHFNVAVGNQPHSEVGALAVFLDRLSRGEAIKRRYYGELEIIPQQRGKRVEKRKWRLPTDRECIQLLREEGCGEDVVDHCKAVAALATRIAKHCGADVEIVRIGALLHDIGRSKTHSIRHAIEGARILKRMGMPRSIVEIVERHIGGGITEEEAKSLGLPPKDYLPQTLEEKIVAEADNLVQGKRIIGIGEAVQELKERRIYGGAERVQNLHRELVELCGMSPDRLVV